MIERKTVFYFYNVLLRIIFSKLGFIHEFNFIKLIYYSLNKDNVKNVTHS